MSLTGRILGILIFLVGIGILLFVFFTAYTMFVSPIPGLTDQSSAAKVTADGLGKVFIYQIIKIILLIVMTIAGSLVAARGVSLYSGEPILHLLSKKNND